VNSLKTKRILTALAFAVTAGLTGQVFAATNAIFYDVPTNDWSYGAIRELAKAGIVSGDPARFDGKNTVTRYEMSIMVANATTKMDKATPAQQAIIEKLATQYGQDIAKVDLAVNPAPVPAAKPAAPAYKPNINFFVDNRIEYTHHTMGAGNKGAWVTNAKLNNKDQLMERIRLYASGNVGDRWAWSSRMVQAKWNWNRSNEDNFRFDRYFLTGKKMLGGTIEVGKMMLYPGKGAFFGNTGDTNGIYYSANPGKWYVRGGLADSSYLTSTSQRIKFLEASYKPNKKLDIGGYVLKQDYSDTISDLDLRVLNGAYEITPKLALSFEWAHNNASPNVSYGHASGKQNGYFVALQSNYKSTNYMPALYTNLVNPFKQGDWGWSVSYRHMPSGVAGLWNRGAFSWVPLTTDEAGSWQNTFDGINAWRADLIYVPWKNVQWTLSYDRIKYHGSGQKNNSFQSTFNFFF